MAILGMPSLMGISIKDGIVLVIIIAFELQNGKGPYLAEFDLCSLC